MPAIVLNTGNRGLSKRNKIIFFCNCKVLVKGSVFWGAGGMFSILISEQ